MPLSAQQLREQANMRERLMDGEVEYTPSPLFARFPKYHVYVYNVGPIEHKIGKGSLGEWIIKPCPKDHPYVLALKVPSLVSSSYFDAASQSMKTDDVEGEFFAQDLVRPFGSDWSIGNSREELGVFWSKTDPPSGAEVAAARAQLEASYRRSLAQATILETRDDLEFITPLMRLAAEYFGEDRAWNRIYKKLTDCPVCSEPLKAGTLKHACGYIVDPVKLCTAGMISEEERDKLLIARGLIQAPGKAGKGKKAPEAQSEADGE